MPKQHMLQHTVVPFMCYDDLASHSKIALEFFGRSNQTGWSDSMTHEDYILSFWAEAFASFTNKTNTNIYFVCVYVQVITFLAFYTFFMLMKRS